MSDLGQLLQQARAYKSVSLREAERATRISRHYLSALEAGDLSQLPPSAYARGIVRNYAQYLGLDPATALGLFDSRDAGERRKPDIGVVPATSRLDIQSHWAPNFAIIAFMIFVSAIVFAWMYSAYFQRADSLPTQTVLGVATVTPVDASIMSVAPTPTEPVPTVAAAGGGIATVTPTPSPTVTTEPSDGAGEQVAESVETPTEEVAEATEDATGLTASPVGTGAHTFVVWVTENLWVEVVLDGETVLSEVLPAGGERIFYGDSVAITTGNSEFAHLYIDGDEYPMGPSWDSTFVWP
jgi:cytoskeletal protein RodZ